MFGFGIVPECYCGGALFSEQNVDRIFSVPVGIHSDSAHPLPIFSMILLGWTWIRLGLRHFFPMFG